MNKTHKCEYCDKEFARKWNLTHHLNKVHSAKNSSEKKTNSVVCLKCDKKFSKRHSLRLHNEKFHPDTLISCNSCERQYTSRRELVKHIEHTHPKRSLNKKIHWCQNCGQVFSTKQNLDQHLVKKHTKRALTCWTCEAKLRTKKSLLCHIKKFHPEQISSVVKRSVFLCPHCGKKLSSKWAVEHHIQKFHPANEYVNEKNKPFVCATCYRNYKTKLCVRRHIKKFHPELVFPAVYNKTVACPDCGTEFSKKWNLNKHREKFHSVAVKKAQSEATKLICPLCKGVYVKKTEIRQHFADEHGLEMETQFLTFYDQTSFTDWRNQQEKETKCSFSIARSYSHNYKKTVYYTCSRSGFYSSKGKGERRIRCVGSKKINAYCPAEIELKIEENCFKVTYLRTHVGHENKICYMKLTEEERNTIIDKLSKGVPPNKILQEMRPPAPSSEKDRQRIHLLSIGDIRNIGNSAGVYDKEKFRAFDDDFASVDNWVEYCKESVLHYKKRNESDDRFPFLEEEDFVLIIMTETQKAMLERHGNSVVALDSTLGVSKYEYVLSTVMVLDDLGCEYPCCFMFSNKVDEHVLDVFFSSVRSRVPGLHAQTVMTDMEELFYGAWVRNVSEPEHRLFSAWHVLRAWKEELAKMSITDIPQSDVKAVRLEMYKFLRFHLLEEKDETNFFRELENFLNENRVMSSFQTHFEEYYVPCISAWAFCFRKYAGIDTDMTTEAFHRLLRYHRLKGKKIQRMEDGLAAVVSYLERKEAERLSIEEKGLESYQVKTIRSRHLASMEGSLSSVDVQDEGWIVPSFKSKDDVVCELYFVRLINNTCVDCKLVCTHCATCAHMYMCTCMDSSMDGNMCKHIHLVCQYQKSVMQVSSYEVKTEENANKKEDSKADKNKVNMTYHHLVNVITEDTKSADDVSLTKLEAVLKGNTSKNEN